MSLKTHLKVTTPRGIFFEDDVDIVTVKTVNGYLGLQANHVPLISALEIGEMLINHRNDKKYQICAVSSGIVYVTRERVDIVTEAAEFKENIDLTLAKQAKLAAELKLKQHLSRAEQMQATVELKKALNLIRIKEGL